MRLAYAVCQHVANGSAPDRYETATPSAVGIACCLSCFEQGNPQAFRASLWQQDHDGFKLVMAGDMRQLDFLQGARL